MRSINTPPPLTPPPPLTSPLTVTSVFREEAEVIKLFKEMEREKYVLRNQEIAQNVAEIRDIRPKLAVDKVWEDHAVLAKGLREELELARKVKEKDDRIEEEIRADKIRMLRAENDVLKKQITIFDPTEIKGAGFLDEMSYLGIPPINTNPF